MMNPLLNATEKEGQRLLQAEFDEISQLLQGVSNGGDRRVLTKEEMAVVLTKERMRCHRRRVSFTLVTFQLEPSAARDEQVAQLSEILLQRLRFTDEVGHLGPNLVGAVLTDTPPANAWKVATDVIESLPDDFGFSLVCVYGYPSESAGKPDGDDSASVSGGSNREIENPTIKSLDALFAQALPLWKRSVDVLAAVISLIVLSPVLLVSALAICITSRGPILFRQRRTGLAGKPFMMWKFRTMHDGAHHQQIHLRRHSDQDGPAFKLRNDPRITPVGRLLRRTSVDELPQLWNVLRGEMTLVGPRPLPCEESDACQEWQRRRLDVTPGLTCIWQATGQRISFDDWMRLDLSYIRTYSLRRDMALILRTMRVVVLGNGN